MIGTLFSIIVALYLLFNPIPFREDSSTAFGITLFLVGTLIFLAQFMVSVFAWGPLQKTEQNIAPRVIQAFKSDASLKISNFFLFAFLLLSYLAAIDAIFIGFFSTKVLLAVWTILLGIAIDALHHIYKGTLRYLNPFEIVEKFSLDADKSIRQNREGEICDWIDALSETSSKAMGKESISLALSGIDKLRQIAQDYLLAVKGVGYFNEANTPLPPGAPDRVSFTLFYLFQRFEFLFEKALSKKLEPVCSGIVSAMGKIMIYAAKYDMTIVDYPLHYLTEFAKEAENAGMPEVGSRASLTMLEVGKTILKEVDVRYVEIKEPYLAMISSMNEIAKETFRKNKSISIKLLVQPFQDLKAAFINEKMASHQDTPAIVQAIDRVLDEFATLESVLSTMPPIPDMLNQPQ